MVYFALAAAIASEVGGTYLLKFTDGFTRLWPSVGSLGLYVVSVFLLAQIVKTLPVGLTYAVWAGMGTVAIVAVGVMFLHEKLDALTVLGLALVVAGVVILNMKSAAH
ncbi:DMT family transporter [Spelaeicoccus albus]|uniref:Small multidrug resistance pump n=1 Tax=Spelaeicoccus albus TaxID=1280376 RepID=A0A7Z0D2Y7_9MICO|nr:multidrug efflux SMR transporter [Spelaeicoccus albus]NYI67914.1 small multidrug resistance pump [Spelaeicoccus albus]